MKKSVKRLAVATVVLGTALIGAQGAAQASFEQCDPTHVCGWGNNDYQWPIIERNSGLGLANHQGEANNNLDSWANRGTMNARGYAEWNYGGDCMTFTRGSSDNNVAPWNSDEVSSTSTAAGC